MESENQPFSLSPELSAEIERVCSEYHGQLDDLMKVVGLIVMGQLYGWHVMRLVSPVSTWSLAIRLFGDPKLLMKDRTPLSKKSYGLKMIDAGLNYWDVVKRITKIPKHELSATVANNS